MKRTKKHKQQRFNKLAVLIKVFEIAAGAFLTKLFELMFDFILKRH